MSDLIEALRAVQPAIAAVIELVTAGEIKTPTKRGKLAMLCLAHTADDLADAVLDLVAETKENVDA